MLTTGKTYGCTIIGNGRVAGSLAGALYRFGGGRFILDKICARNPDAAVLALPDVLKTHVVRIGELGSLSGIVFLAVADDAIEEVAKSLSDLPVEEETICCHLSGALGTEPLRALAGKGARTAAFHPLQSFALADPEAFSEITITLHSETEVPELEELAWCIGSTPAAVSFEEKQRLHIAAVFASNYLVTLLRTAEELLPDRSDEVLEMLWPLIDTTLSNIVKSGTDEALTGPVSRADTGTVKAHLQLLKSRDSASMLPLYAELGKQTCRQALDSGRFTRKQFDRLMELFDNGGGA
jgi:predicted short-subunit dehydrogenase-like oxidoreductase (DUF2520 family)